MCFEANVYWTYTVGHWIVVVLPAAVCDVLVRPPTTVVRGTIQRSDLGAFDHQPPAVGSQVDELVGIARLRTKRVVGRLQTRESAMRMT